MVLQTLLLLNITVSTFLTGHPGSLTFTTDHPTPPDTTIDFGDGTFQEKSLLSCQLDEHSLSSVCSTHHTYRAAGLHTIRLHDSEAVYGEVEVAVEDPLEGVQVTLLYLSPIVALLEEVVVECRVESGTNLTFEWDFGDDTDGQYTMVESSDLSSTAHHSYGVADAYNISVVVRSPLQSLLGTLNTTVRAVELIEALHLRPLSGRFAAPLLQPASTPEVAFEAWVWKGSDVEFEFDFGDGEREVVTAELNEWDMPWALSRHRYTEEGSFWVSVTAFNPLDWVNKTLEQAFYVQFPPENLHLDQSYYVVRNGADLQLHATVSGGSDVVFDWQVGDDFRCNTTDGNLTVPLLRPGNYIVRVEASNQVTDMTTTIERSSTSARIYVQEVLQSLTLCLKLSNGTAFCDDSELELPLDEAITFEARATPPVESTLRFVWHLGSPDLKRTNSPTLVHRYREAGRYRVNITAQNLVSTAASPHLLLHVVQRVSNLTAVYSPDATLVGRNVTLQARYWFGSDLTFLWRFGDGTPDVRTREATVRHVFHRPGEYWVRVEAWNSFSRAEVATNLFFLDRVCEKPDIVFLNDGQTLATSDVDILIEANVGMSCPGANASYSWTITEVTTGVPFDLTSAGIPSSQRQLILPCCLVCPGVYDVRLKVSMAGTIVYSSASTTLQVKAPEPSAVIGGGFVRVVGRNDTLEMEAGPIPSQHHDGTWSYHWSCSPLIMKQLSCFVGAPSHNNKSRFLLPVASLHPTLMAVEMNVSIGSGELQLRTSQVVEIAAEPHTLMIELDCVSCRDHRVNRDERVVLRATDDEDDLKIRYRWSLWLVQDAEDDLASADQDCVPADGSTFFIVAPNATEDATSDNSNSLQEQTRSEITLDFHELPPFPLSPKFPETNSVTELKIKEEPPASTAPGLPSFHRMPVEGEDVYDDTLIGFPYPEFLPDGAELPLGSPAHVITEEGVPGESGSAYARDQRTHDFHGAFPEDDDDESILEGAGTSRIVGNGLLPDVTGMKGDPVRNDDDEPRFTHLVQRPRLRVAIPASDSTTGLESRYLVVKPGLLRAGATYLAQVDVETIGNPKLIGSASEFFRVRPGPSHGRCSLLPAGGSFRLHCLEWRARGPLTYALRYALDPDRRGHLLYFGYNSNLKFQLPPGRVESNHSVYVNVAVQDDEGAVTTVCSLVRQVLPLQLNTSLEHYIYNESTHPNSTLRRLQGEGLTQALLGRMHVLLTSLNSAPPLGGMQNELRKKIRLLYLETIAGLTFYSKVEAVQVLSVLSEMVSGEISNVSSPELERCYEVFLKIYRSKKKLYSACPPRALEQGIETFLSRLAFHASARIEHGGFPRMMAVAREHLEEQIKETIQFRLVPKEPYQIDLPHYFARAVHLASTDSARRPPVLIPLKKTRLLLGDGSHLDLSRDNSVVTQGNRCHDCDRRRNCSVWIAKEWDYVAKQFLEQESSQSLENLSTSVNAYSCDLGKEIKWKGDMEFTTHFPRMPLEAQNVTTLTTDVLNVHSIDVAGDVRLSLLFHMALEPTNDSAFDFPIQVLFRYKDPPLPKEYDLKKTYSSGIKKVNFFVPESYLKETGPYHFAVLTARQKASEQTTSTSYRLRIWQQVCFGKTDEVWRSDVCRGLESSNERWMHCRCTAPQMYAYSVPSSSSVRLVAMDTVLHPFSPIPAIALSVLLTAYFILVVVHRRRDKLKSPSASPIPLRDNCLGHQQMYVVQVRTGSRASSGTTSAVFVVLHGVSGLTETRQLIGCGQKRFLLQRGSVDTFLMSTHGSLGPLIKLEIWHDNSGPSPSWYLVEVTVKDALTGQVYRFACDDWLSAERGDGLVDRQISVAEMAPVIAEIFPEILRRSWYEFHVWNAVVCESIVSPLTGAQKITCCLCFILNSAALLLLHTEVLGRLFHPLNTPFLLGIIASLLSSIPQTIILLLFRFATPLPLQPSSRLLQILGAVPPYSLRCWWRKRSTGDSGTSGSARESADSLYSSASEGSSRFGEGSEVPDLSEEELSLSASSFDVNGPVSPLQKTFSTWQVVESWVRRKNDVLLSQEQKQLSVKDLSLQRAFPRPRLRSGDSDAALSGKSSLTSLGRAGTTPTSGSPASSEVDPSRLNLGWRSSYLPSPAWCCGAWVVLLGNLVLSVVFFLAQASRLETQDLVLLLRGVFISVLCSCCVIHPVIVLLAAVTSSVRELSTWRHRDSANDDQVSQRGSPGEVVSRIEYFKAYLRPPKEHVLHEFRRVALRERNLVNCISRSGGHFLLLLLLCGLAWPDDLASRYSQRRTILNAFSFKGATVPDTPEALWHSMWRDFLSSISECQNPTNHECSFASRTGCQPVGAPALRHRRVHAFESPEGAIGKETPEMKEDIIELTFSHQEQTVRILSDHWFNHSSVNLEVTLFNPTTSFLIMVSLDVMSLKLPRPNVAVSSVQLPDADTWAYSIHFTLQLILFTLTLISIRTLTREWIENKRKCSFRQVAFSHRFIFIFISMGYLTTSICSKRFISAALDQVRDSGASAASDLAFAALWQSWVRYLVGALIFLHLLGTIPLLSFKQRWHVLLRRLGDSSKGVLPLSVIFLLFLFLFSFVSKVIGVPDFHARHLTWLSFSAINAILKDYRKALVVIQSTHPLDAAMLLLFLTAVVTFHVCFVALVRVLFLHYRLRGDHAAKSWRIADLRRVVQRKIAKYFVSNAPQVVTRDETALPMEFLLFELEHLADKLVQKADILFSDLQQPSIVCEDRSDRDESDVKDYRTVERASTLPLPKDYLRREDFACRSLTTQRRLGKQQTCRIRKTYPLTQACSNSSSEGVAAGESVLRRTKSKGKDGKCDLDVEGVLDGQTNLP